MLCSDTGKLVAVRLKHLNLDLAKDIDDALGAISTYGHGDGEIKIPVSKGKVSILDLLFRKFRDKTTK